MAPHDNGEDVRGQPCSWTLEESEVESYEHQDNANIHCQPFPESVSEEREIYTDDNGYHRHHVKHVSYLSAHFSLLLKPTTILYIGDRPEAVVLQFPGKVRVIKRGPDSGRRSVGLHLLAISFLNVWSIPKLREQEHNYGDNCKDPNKQQSLIDLLRRILKVGHVRSP